MHQTKLDLHTGFLRLPDVLKLIPIGKSSWWEGVKGGLYPQPVRIGKRVTAWRVEDIHTLIDHISKAQANKVNKVNT